MARGDPDAQRPGQIANCRRGPRLTALPSTPARTAAAALISRRGVLQARHGGRGLSPGASRTVMPSEERERTTFHESGHVLLGMLTPAE